MKISRLQRIMKLLTEIESGRATSAAYLVNTLGVSRRTIFRDLDALAAAGNSCTYSRPLGRFVSDRIMDGTISLDETECLSLLIMFCQADIPPYVESNARLRQAISKVVGAMPYNHRVKSFKLLRQCHPDHDKSNIFQELELWHANSHAQPSNSMSMKST